MKTYELPLDLMRRRYRVLNNDCKKKGKIMTYDNVITMIKENYADHPTPFGERPCPENHDEILPFRFLSKKNKKNDVWYVPPYTINKSDNMIRFYPEKTQDELEHWAVPYEIFEQEVDAAAKVNGLYRGGNRTRRRR